MNTLIPRLSLAAATLGLLATSCVTPAQRTSSDQGRTSAPATIAVATTAAVMPIGGRHVAIATVRDAEGRPVANAEVEWMALLGGVGGIVDFDRGNRASERASHVYAVTRTGGSARAYDMGTAAIEDDVQIGPGQTYVVLTSASEGAAQLMAAATGVADAAARSAVAQPAWVDAIVRMEPGVTGRLGDKFASAVKVTSVTTGKPIEGQLVTFSVADGAATVGGKSEVTVTTGKDGVAKAEVAATRGDAASKAIVSARAVRPKDEKCCKPEVYLGAAHGHFGWLAAAIGIVKTAPEKAVVGDPFQYDIVVSNPSDVTARGVKVADALPAGIAYVSSTPSAAVQGQNLSWTLGDIPAKGSKKIQLTVRAERTGTFENCADVTAEEGRLKARSCDSTLVTAPALRLAKSGTAEALLCDPLEYRLVVTNTGDAVARNVKVRDELPAGVSTTDGKRIVESQVGDLAPGQSREVTIVAKAERTGTFSNAATATADGGLKAESGKVSTVVKRPVLKLTKQGPERIFLGRDIEYTVTIGNTGDGVAKNLVVRDVLPAKAAFVSATDGGAHQAGVVTWSVAALNPGQTLTYSVKVRPGEDGAYLNQASATAYCADAVAAQASTNVEGIPAILLEVVDVVDPVEVGTNTTYVITVTNQGTAVGKDIRVRAEIPREMGFVSAQGATSGSAAGQVVTFAPLATLAPGAKAEFRITVRANAAADVRFKVSMTSAKSSVPIEETESTYLYE